MEVLSVPLRGSGRVALVDACDWDAEHFFTRRDGVQLQTRPCDVAWGLSKNRHGWYATAHRTVGGEDFLLTMHRLVIDAPAGKLVDHANGDTLDNRLANLRLATHAQNAVNTRRGVGTADRSYRGVRRHGNAWEAQVSTRTLTGIRSRLTVGRFANIDDAARAYDAAARVIYGEFANPNLPDAAPFELPPHILSKLHPQEPPQ